MVKVSIIIPNWNTLDYLKKCVESIKKYTKDYELIILDNGSKEKGTKQYINSVADKWIFSPKNMGFSKGNNMAASIAGGEFFCFLNSDTEVGENWLKDLLILFEKKNCGAVGPLANPTPTNIYYPQHKGQYSEDTRVPVLVGVCLLIKKGLFEKIGGWEESFKNGYEDNYLSELIKKEGKDLWISVNSKVYHKEPSQTFKANNLNYLKTLEYNKNIFEEKMELLNG